MTRLTVVMLTVFVDSFGFGIVIPFLPLYASSLGASGLEVGLLLATYSLAQMIVAPRWGRLSDRVGRKPIMVIAAAGTCASFVVLGIGDNLALIFGGRALLGCFGVGYSTAQAWVADTTPIEERSRVLALIGASHSVGFALGPALGAVGVMTGGLSAPFWFAAGCAAVSALLAATLLPAAVPQPRTSTAPRLRDFSGNRSFAICLAVSFGLTYAFSNIEATFSLFTSDELAFTPTENGLFFVLIGLCAAATQVLVTRRLARRFPEHICVILGLVLLGAGAASIPFANSGASLIAPMVVLAAGFAITTPSLTAWVSRSAPADRQGEALGLSMSAAAMARIAGPGVGGLMYDELGHG
ncbi:MAG: MFS transporter, partial [Deltaproteobacteria bacterium]|nr:MFS transporter [Deltaproteobacteria bacterium]